MCDEWLKCLMILAAEKDILSRLKNDDIIDRFAETSDDLAQVLRCLWNIRQYGNVPMLPCYVSVILCKVLLRLFRVSITLSLSTNFTEVIGLKN
jgi:hypothetical protein